MEQETPLEVSLDTVTTMLLSYKAKDSTRSGEIQSLLAKAKSLVRQHCKGSFAKGHEIATEDILTAVAEHATADPGRRYVATAIIACEEHREAQRTDFLATLAGVWLTQLLFPMKEAGTKGTSPNFDEQTPTQDEIATLLEQSKDGDLNALRVVLRRRQCERCPISNAYTDEASPEQVKDEIRSALKPARPIPVFKNEFNKNRRSSPVELTSLTWNMLAAWGSLDPSKDTQKILNGPANAFLARVDVAMMFEKFKWWFEPTGRPHEYEVASQVNTGYNGQIVTFVNHDSQPIDVPDPKMLALHAAFARVFHASGAGDYIQSVWSDAEDIHLLSGDGATSLLSLDIALQRLAIVNINHAQDN